MKMNKLVGLSLAMMLGFSVVGCNNTLVKEKNGDEIFIKEFSKAINERWSDLEEITEKYEKKKITESENFDLTIESIQEEIDTINENLINIESKELKQLAEKYVEGDEMQIKYLQASDGELAYNFYEQMQQLRKPTLITLVEEYGATINEEHMQTYKNFKEEATVINKQNGAKEFLDKMATEVVVEKTTDEWGNVEYIVIIENNSEVDFKLVQYQVNYKDSEGVVVGNDWIYLENFDKNTKQKYTLYTYDIKDIESVVLTTDYFEIKE